MKQLILILCLLSVAFSIETPVSLLGTFAQGINSGLNIAVDQKDFKDCEGKYWEVLTMSTGFVQNLFTDWNMAFILMNGFGGINYQSIMKDWQTSCAPVYSLYEMYFYPAYFEYTFDNDKFWSIIEENFNANGTEVLNTMTKVARLLSSGKSGDAFKAGEEFAYVVRTVMRGMIADQDQKSLVK